MTTFLALSALWGCASKDMHPPPSYAPAHVDWTALSGSAPRDPAPLPDFRATSHDGGARGPEDLRGKPTALWFYPAANTPG